MCTCMRAQPRHKLLCVLCTGYIAPVCKLRHIGARRIFARQNGKKTMGSFGVEFATPQSSGNPVSRFHLVKKIHFFFVFYLKTQRSDIAKN